jgi:CheY-like chemotaxis protein
VWLGAQRWISPTGLPVDPAAASPLVSRRTASILVVEDDADERGILCEILDGAGYQVGAAADGTEALVCVLTGPPPDLILLDLCMPILDGWGFMAELKARPALAAIPVVVMSGAGEEALNRAPVSAGYLRKPLKLPTLLETIEGALWRRKRHSRVTRPGDDGAPPAS